ncbi:MAG: hypothetical protein HN548_10615 [Opitutae bacterium]|jgi:hypothetical protein|nr:hypothetical protein [Opitutae bacterium]MBT5717158.1 hypothetical protein [Opitutae bacterium]
MNDPTYLIEFIAMAQPNGGPSNQGLISFLPMILIAIFTALSSRFLAKDKGRNTGAWTIVGCIPMIGFFSLILLVGCSCLKTKEKLDMLLEQHDK